MNYFSTDKTYPPRGRYAILFTWFVLDDKDDEESQIIVQNHDILDRHFAVDRLRDRMGELGIKDVDELPYNEERRFAIRESQRRQLGTRTPYQFERIKETLLSIIKEKVRLFERAAVGRSPGANFREFVGWTVLTSPEWNKEVKTIYRRKKK